MSSLRFVIVDVFAEKLFAGNQLAVITHAAGVSDERMQQIAREINYSETTFILSDRCRNGGYDVRIFTPKEEIPFAGHPTLGTAYVIAEILGREPSDPIQLNLGVGQVPVHRQNELLWMTTPAPQFGETFKPLDMAAILNLDVGDIDTRFPIQIVSTGLPFILVPLKTLKAVKNCQVNVDALLTLIGSRDISKSVFVFCPETYEKANQINARMFAHYYGIPEDPATGSANSCLAGYLVKHRYFGKDSINLTVEQGMEIHRPSRLYLDARQNGNTIHVRVGGKVQLIAKGELI